MTGSAAYFLNAIAYAVMPWVRDAGANALAGDSHPAGAGGGRHNARPSVRQAHSGAHFRTFPFFTALHPLWKQTGPDGGVPAGGASYPAQWQRYARRHDADAAFGCAGFDCIADLAG